MKHAETLIPVLLILCAVAMPGGCAHPPEQTADPVRLSVVFDNIPCDERLQTPWGFACLVEGYGKNVLFDTGGVGDVLLSNMQTMGIDPQSIDLVVLSHAHGDHTNGLDALSRQNPGITVYMPKSFPAAFKQKKAPAVTNLVEVTEPVEILDGMHLTGEMGSSIVEEALILETRKGLVVVTGCAHPGIVSILERAKELSSKPIHLVMGGFHLPRHSEEEVLEIIASFRELDVRKAAPSHCTGDEAIALFREAYGDDFVEIGCGAILELSLGGHIDIRAAINDTALPASL